MALVRRLKSQEGWGKTDGQTDRKKETGKGESGGREKGRKWGGGKEGKKEGWAGDVTKPKANKRKNKEISLTKSSMKDIHIVLAKAKLEDMLTLDRVSEYTHHQ